MEMDPQSYQKKLRKATKRKGRKLGSENFSCARM